MKSNYIFKAILSVYKRSPKSAIFSDIFLISTTAAEIVSIYFGGKFIDETAQILANTETFSIVEYFSTESFFYLAICLALWITQSVLSNMRDYLQRIVYLNHIRGVQIELPEIPLKENLQELESKEFFDLLSYVPNHAFGAVYYAYVHFSELFRQITRVLSALFMLISTLNWLGLLILLFAFPQPLVEFYRKKNLVKYMESEIERTKLISYIDQFIKDTTNFSELKVNSTFKHIKSIFSRETKIYDNGNITRFFHLNTDKSLSAGIGHIGVTIVTIASLALAIAKRLTIGEFKAIYDYIYTCYDGFGGVMNQVFLLAEESLYIEKYYNLKDYNGFGDMVYGDKKLERKTPSLEFSNVDFQYREKKTKTLENLNFIVNPGEKVAIVGGDGSGKSTLIKVLCGLYAVPSGEYYIDGYSIRELERGALKNKLALVPQDFNTYYFSIKQNILIGNPNVGFNKTLYDKVKRVCELDKIMIKEALKDSQVLGKNFAHGREISPGYWQRIAIARALYRNRQITVMDEPFALIDQEARARILKNVIEFLGSDRTLILITQDMENLDQFDKVFTLKAGQIAPLSRLK